MGSLWCWEAESKAPANSLYSLVARRLRSTGRLCSLGVHPCLSVPLLKVGLCIALKLPLLRLCCTPRHFPDESPHDTASPCNNTTS